MGNRWGPEGPPQEAYSRVTDPERFAPLLVTASDLLDRLERDFHVAREEGYGLDARLEHDPARPTVRLMPSDPEAGSLTVGFGKFPGIMVRLGRWFVVPIPSCGCDACDETAEEGERKLSAIVHVLTSGRFSEWIVRPLIGSAWYHHAMPYEWGSSRLERAEAKARISEAGGRSRFDYAPWPRHQSR